MMLINKIAIVVLTGVLSTVFITGYSLYQGVITAKYFWFAACMCIVSLLIPFQLYKKNEIHVTDILFGTLVVYICINWFHKNGHPDMHCFLSLLMLPLYVAVRTVAKNEKYRQKLLDIILIIVLIEVIWGLLQLYGFAHSHHNLYKITGTLPNPGPYSGFIAVGVPLALGFLLDKKLFRWERWLGGITLITTLLVLPPAMSRAAWIATVIGCFFCIKPHVSIQKYLKLDSAPKSVQYITRHLSPIVIRITIATTIGLLTLLLLSGIYLMKKDSADGRWVIWSVSMETVKEHPVFGAGYGRFAAVYGNAQANYFLSDKGSEAKAMVTDSPEFAFSEYIQIAVELGFVGIVLFLLLIASPFMTRTPPFIPLHASLITFLVFSAFSYPFSSLPLSILFVFLLAASAPSSRKIPVMIPVSLRIVRMAICISISIYVAYQILPLRTVYRDFSMAHLLHKIEAYNSAEENFRSLYPSLKYEKQFLFEYGNCLSKTGNYIESNRIFERYLYYGSDPMAYNCMGNNFKGMGDFKKAEDMYIYASKIAPNRHYPLYLLMKLYSENGETKKAEAIADTLLNKTVKVLSTAIHEMREEARKIIITGKK